MKIFIIILSLVFSFSAIAAEGPIEGITCEAGGEYGRNLRISLSRDYQYGELQIKRQKARTDYTRDLSKFKGGSYRLDLAPKGGFVSLHLEYKESGSETYNTLQSPIACSAEEAVKTGSVAVEHESEPKTQTAVQDVVVEPQADLDAEEVAVDSEATPDKKAADSNYNF